jgi:aminopeptidase N
MLACEEFRRLWGSSVLKRLLPVIDVFAVLRATQDWFGTQTVWTRKASTRVRRVAAVSLVVLGVGLAACSAYAAHPSPPTPGAPGIGDPLFPRLGNGGYDVRRYALDLTYPTRAPQQTVSGTVTAKARATQTLSRFDLDFLGNTVEQVSVNGAVADWTLSGGKLVITPRAPLRDKKKFVVRVTYTSHPANPEMNPFTIGWFPTRDGSVTAFQPLGASALFPVNDHPADKASYSFRIDVPQGTTAVANGVFAGSSTLSGRTVWTYEQRQPMASELIQMAVGDLDVVERGSYRDVQLRDVVAHTVVENVAARLDRTRDQLAWMESKVGRYPFDTYGVLAPDQFFFYALETQTLSLFPPVLFLSPPEFYEPIMVHELAHQWFGDSVSPVRWSDVWLNEGHASWYEKEYAAEKFGVDFEAYIRDTYSHGDQWRAAYGPVASPTRNDLLGLFSPNVYGGGATVLYALRQVVGDPTFREIERRWVQRYRGDSVGTESFIALASEVSHRDLTGFLRDWLYGTKTPAMPGHPEWTVAPVGVASPQPESPAQSPSAPSLGARWLQRY